MADKVGNVSGVFEGVGDMDAGDPLPPAQRLKESGIEYVVS